MQGYAWLRSGWNAIVRLSRSVSHKDMVRQRGRLHEPWCSSRRRVIC